MKFLGAPYPIVKHPRGYFRTQSGLDQVKSDMLILLLTNPGERPMLPEFGVPLRKLIFDPNDVIIAEQAKDMIAAAIRLFEPRITIDDIDVSTSANPEDLNSDDDLQQLEHILMIKIRFFDRDDIQEVQELKLEVPLSGG